MIRRFEENNHAELYKKYRRTTPKIVVDEILQWMKQKPDGASEPETAHRKPKVAVDVGCGSGQHTLVFAPFFEKVYGFDVSEAQIAASQCHLSDATRNVTFEVAPAEQLGLPDRSVQLVTGSFSFHWFDLDKFYEEVDRVLEPGGVVAAVGHGMWSVAHEVKGKELSQLLWNFVVDYLQGGRHERISYLVNCYGDLPLPYAEERRIQDMPLEFQGTLVDVIGGLRSLSSFQALYKKEPVNVEQNVDQFRNEFLRILGLDPCTPIKTVPVQLHYDYFVAMCRKPLIVVSPP